jgi:hypothetical protein
VLSNNRNSNVSAIGIRLDIEAVRLFHSDWAGLSLLINNNGNARIQPEKIRNRTPAMISKHSTINPPAHQKTAGLSVR